MKTDIETVAGWDELWDRVRMTFSEDDEERYVKRVALRDKMLRKNNLEAPPVEEGKLKAAMVDYAESLRHGDSMRKNGVTNVDLLVADKYCPEVMMVQEFIRRMRNAARDAKRADDVSRWESALDVKAVDHEGASKANVHAAMFLLEHVEKRTFGKEEQKGDDGQKQLQGGGIQLNIIGDAALKMLKPPSAGEKSGGVFIDV